jgi:hypothetical protein
MPVDPHTTELSSAAVGRILEAMSRIDGWLTNEEAGLLIAITERAVRNLPPGCAVAEVGSYCGRSTVVLGGAIKALESSARVYAIDPHEGLVGAADSDTYRMEPTLARFEQNIADAGLASVVELIRKRSFEVSWCDPISLLFIDGLHDYGNVRRDFFHFDEWIVPSGYAAFHDCGDYYPGVRTFVEEILREGRYRLAAHVQSLAVLQKASDL